MEGNGPSKIELGTEDRGRAAARSVMAHHQPKCVDVGFLGRESGKRDRGNEARRAILLRTGCLSDVWNMKGKEVEKRRPEGMELWPARAILMATATREATDLLMYTNLPK